MTPLAFLGLMMMLCGGAWVIWAKLRARHVRALRALATQRGFRYVEQDVLGIARRLAEGFPVVGAADLVVSDVAYRQEEGGYRYVFTAHYTLGVVRLKRRVRRAAMCTEPCDAPPQHCPERVELGPGDVPLREQYARFLGAVSAHPE